MRLLDSELAQAQHVTPAFKSKSRFERLAPIVRVLQNTQNVFIWQTTANKSTKIYNARPHALFYYVLVTAAVVVCLSSLLFKAQCLEHTIQNHIVLEIVLRLVHKRAPRLKTNHFRILEVYSSPFRCSFHLYLKFFFN